MKKLYFLALSVLASASLMAAQVKVAAGSDLQAAVNGASSGDTVLVQAGTYEGNFTMKDGVYVSGGWNEDFTAQTEHASILDAKQSGRVLNQPENFDTLTTWENFTIQNGKLKAIAADKLGAGVALMKKGRVINCLVQNNTFDYSGNCMGGGIGQETGDKNDTCAINCVVRYNTATHGGGVRIRGVILNSTIEYNESSNNGGGLYLQAGSAYNCIITNNVSLSGGGGVDMFGTGSLVNCLVANNTAGNVGGLSMRSSSRDTDDSGSDIINCTIVNNTQKNTNNPQFCGVRLDVRRNPNRAFVNNVVYGNTINGEVQAQELGGYPQGYGKFLNNAVAGTTANVTYIQLDAENAPQFNENYSFAWTSPLYNAGSNDALAYFVGDKDVYGNARKQGANMEIGAVEHTEYKATLEIGVGGTVEVDYTGEKTPLVAGEISVPAGFTTKLYVTPAENYALETITLNGEALVAEEGVYTIPAVAGNITLKVVFDCTLTLYKLVAGEDLQAAVDNADAGDTILVQAGTYEGNFTMKDGVYVSGGWNADFTEQTQHASILDAKASGRVLNQPANFETLTIWDNFTIQNGKLTAADGVKNLGAGVALMQKGRVINCLIQNNTFDYSGNCIGGGIGQDVGDRNDTCAINCVVRNNQASHGGGVRIRGVILNSVIEYNKTTTNAAGGMHLQGGAAYNCIIRFNESLKDLGGVRLYGACDLVNCLIVGNKSAGKVGGLQAENVPSNIINCTVVGNEQAATGNEAVFCGFRDNINDAAKHNGKFFVNNVVYGNKVAGEVQAEQVHTYIKHYVTNGTFANNAFQGVADLGATYIQLSAENDPQFNEDYSFATTSPLYNAGSNDALAYFVGDKDVYGNARKQGANIEIGAVEIAEPTQTIITETFDLTTEDTRNMMGTYNVYAGDYILRIYGYAGAGTYQDDPATEENESPLLFTPDYDDALNAVVVVTIDEENNKEVMQVTATSADGLKIYNLTFNIALPNTVEHLVVPTEFKVEQIEPEPGLVVWSIEGKALMDTEDNVIDFWATVDPTAYIIEAGFGEVYAFGEAAISDPFMGEISIESILKDEAGNTYNFSIVIPEFKQEVEITVAETVELTAYKLAFEVQGNMANVSAIVGDIELTFAMSLNSADNGYGTYFNDAIWNVWYGNDANGFVALTPYGDEHVYSAENFKVSFISQPDAEGNVTLYNFTLIPGEKPADPTGLDNINATVAPVKMIENGRLVIICNGAAFNSIGQKL